MEKAREIRPITCSADETFTVSKEFKWNGHSIELFETPGHSSGSICVIIDKMYIFTGDSLLKNIPVVTKMPSGSKELYNKITRPFFEDLNKNLYVYPGHGESDNLKKILGDSIYE